MSDICCPICKSTNLEIIDYLIPTHGDVYWCSICAKNGKPAKWTSLAVHMFAKQMKEHNNQ